MQWSFVSIQIIQDNNLNRIIIVISIIPLTFLFKYYSSFLIDNVNRLAIRRKMWIFCALLEKKDDM